MSNRTVLGRPPQPYSGQPSSTVQSVLGTNPYEPYSNTEIPLLGSEVGTHRKIGENRHFMAWSRTWNRTRTHSETHREMSEDFTVFALLILLKTSSAILFEVSGQGSICLSRWFATAIATVRTETIAYLILGRTGPVIFGTALLELKPFRLIPVTCPARRDSKRFFDGSYKNKQRTLAKTKERSWNVLLREPSGDKIARSFRHTVPDLTVKTEVKDRIANSLLSQGRTNHEVQPVNSNTWIFEAESA